MRPVRRRTTVDFGGERAVREGRARRNAQQSPHLQDQSGDGVPRLLRQAGFGAVEVSSHAVRWIGPVVVCRAAA